MTDPLISVEVGVCRCPDTPHPDGDIVYLSPTLGLRGGLTAERLMVNVWGHMKLTPGGKRALVTEASLELEAGLREAYVRFGVVDWNLEDEDGLIPLNEDTIKQQLLDDFTRSRPIGEKADEIYSGAVMDPLLGRLLTSSPSSRRGRSTSTSRSPASSSKRPKLVKPSSTSTTPTDATAMTS